MIDVARFREANDGMNQDISLPCASSSYGQLAMSAMHRVPCLECHDTAPSKLLKMGAELRRSKAKSNVVIVLQSVNGFKLTTDVKSLSGIE